MMQQMRKEVGGSCLGRRAKVEEEKLGSQDCLSPDTGQTAERSQVTGAPGGLVRPHC